MQVAVVTGGNDVLAAIASALRSRLKVFGCASQEVGLREREPVLYCESSGQAQLTTEEEAGLQDTGGMLCTIVGGLSGSVALQT
jgi:hypothetical protein